jgi:hypothetical protein
MSLSKESASVLTNVPNPVRSILLFTNAVRNMLCAGGVPEEDG